MGMRATFEAVVETDHRVKKDKVLDLDKMWQPAHFLLTGDPWNPSGPLGAAVMGGTGVGEDYGYGPARLLTAAQVREVAAALDAVRDDELRASFDPAAFARADIYPAIWDEPRDDLAAEVVGAVSRLRAYYRRAADAGHGMLVLIC